MIKRMSITLSAILVLMYFGGAFINWHVSPGEWEDPARGIFVVLYVLAAVAAWTIELD